MLAPAIEWYMSERAQYIKGDVLAVECSVAKDEAALHAPFTPDGVDFGIFLDFTSIWCRGRAAPQQLHTLIRRLTQTACAARCRQAEGPGALRRQRNAGRQECLGAARL